MTPLLSIAASLLLACTGQTVVDTGDPGGRRDSGGSDIGDWDSGWNDGGADGGAGDTGGTLPASCDQGAAAIVGDAGYRTLEAAVADAADGATVTVCPGEHRLAGVLDGRSLDVVGSSGIAAEVLLSPVADDPVFFVKGGGTLRLADLTITRNRSKVGAALRIDSATLQLERCTLSDNAGVGGAVRLQAATGTTARLEADTAYWVSNRTESLGSAVSGTGSGQVDISITGSSLVANQADQGGAVYLGSGSGSLSISGTELVDNTAMTLGGAVMVNVDDGVVDIVESRMIGNDARDGGGLYLSSRGQRMQVTVDASVVEGNVAKQQGGGIFFGSVDSTMTLSGAWIADNRARDGGGLHIEGHDGLGVTLSASSTTFTGNSAELSGAAIDVFTEELTGSITLEDCLVDRNDSADAAVDLGVGVSLTSSSTSWGEGDTDNQPADLQTATVLYDDLGADESVTCDGDGVCTR